MENIKTVKDFENGLKDWTYKLGELDYIKVEGINYIMKSYDQEWQSIIWEEEIPWNKEQWKVMCIELHTKNRYDSLEDAKIEDYYYEI